ncbi:2'-5' RNA ligase family protein [Rubellimicrobium rubrum]|uniref:2'-5' RNA ligase family protein n=1 Tax=Rubellimicrobium rubrum TaxID=2585369 RepID=A0A5C4MPM5_9RHOB|nr:2'-5' RNA ligase family protein [Rubellimicrobium rubrum]TNC46550.1 2'-5' RNA ligase family protein [Rubellimicrobium rubrum]
MAVDNRTEGPGEEPLILTLALDPDSFARFDRERRAHFPARLNRIPAHVTLFHHLPGSAEQDILATLGAACAVLGPMPVRVTGLFSLGKGVAYRMEASAIADLRRDLARQWRPWLTAQDLQPWKPHVTVQNKVTPADARETLARLQTVFVPFEAWAEGLLLWRYMGGPWDALGRFPFAGAD